MQRLLPYPFLNAPARTWPSARPTGDRGASGGPPAGYISAAMDQSWSGQDVFLLFEKLVVLYTPYAMEGDPQELRKLVRAESLERYDEYAWEQGYRLAEDVLDDLALPDPASDWIYVEKLYQLLVFVWKKLL